MQNISMMINGRRTELTLNAAKALIEQLAVAIANTDMAAQTLDARHVGRHFVSALQLDDVRKFVEIFPSQFSTPDVRALESISPGHSVKVGTYPVEAFWIAVDAVDGDNLSGRIVTELLHGNIHGLKEHDLVSFGKENVVEISH